MVEEPSWSGNKEIDTLLELVGLCTSLRSSDDYSVSLIMVLKEVSSPLVVLHSQLTSWSDHEHTGSILWGEMSLA